MLGISQSYISRLEKKIINKMKRDIMSKTGWYLLIQEKDVIPFVMFILLGIGFSTFI